MDLQQTCAQIKSSGSLSNIENVVELMSFRGNSGTRLACAYPSTCLSSWQTSAFDHFFAKAPSHISSASCAAGSKHKARDRTRCDSSRGL